MLVASGLHRFGKGGVHLPEIRLKPQADALQPGHPAHCRVVRLRMPDDQRGLMNRRVIGRGYGRKVRLAERDAPPVNGPVPSGPENGLAHSSNPFSQWFAVAIRKAARPPDGCREKASFPLHSEIARGRRL